jgi:hypothetical protein
LDDYPQQKPSSQKRFAKEEQMKPEIIITEEIVKELEQYKDHPVDLFGFARIEENLVQILSLKPRDELKRVARYSEGKIEIDQFGLSIPLSEIDPIPILDEFTSRSNEIVDTDVLGQKKVVFIGAGSVGSQIALSLAQSAVGRFSILDLDFLSASNLSRHACDINDLGRYKTLAVRDLILRRNPSAIIETYEEDFLSLDWKEQVMRVQGADLVIASTDSNAAQFMVNEVCHGLGIPSLYVGCYERACAGEILFVIPGKTPCFNCFMEFRQSTLEEAKKKERHVPYADEDPSSFKGEPGLAIDISYIVSIASAYALAMLLKDSERKALLNPERNLILVHSGNPPRGNYKGIFQMPFDLLLAKVKRDKECLVCSNFVSTQGDEDGPTTHSC